MNNYLKNILLLTLALLFIAPLSAANADREAEKEEEFVVRDFILNHLADSYEWHIATFGETHVSIPLPVIIYSKTNGFNVFMSSKFHHGHAEYNGFRIAQDGDYKGKIVETNEAGEEVRPCFDISMTRNVVALIFNSTVLICLILGVARWYKKQEKNNTYEAPKGIVGVMEMFIMSVVDDIIKPAVGKQYRKYTPYLLTAFFFIFLNNVFGLIPIFPFGANTTGNIAVTLTLALFTFVIVNVKGSREYWREIFWPDVPLFLKSPVFPMMQVIEFVGIFTKPFSLMIRLFANILAGHSIVLGLTCLIFVTVSLGAAMNGAMMGVSVVLSVFILFVEILVAYIQAYVFTMLSAVYIGLARVEPHHH